MKPLSNNRNKRQQRPTLYECDEHGRAASPTSWYSLYNEAANKYAVTSGNLIIKLSLSNSASNYFDLSDASTVASNAVYLTASVPSAKCLSIIDQSFGIVDTDDCQPLYLYKLESDSSDYAMQSSIRALNGGEVFPTEKVEYINGNSAWGDQLTQIKTYSISTNGTQTLTNTQTLSYDSMGNPTSYLGTTMTWQGKQLATATKNGNNYGYFYDENGLRLRKTTNGVATNYYYNGSVLIGMTAGSTTQKFSYDSSGSVVSVNYNGTEYYYIRNAQGDIVKLIDNAGSTVVEYKYDSWSKQLSCTGALATTLGTNQPFRYRGYVYDAETGWYYLQSRYYNPEVGRFISADVYLSTGQGVLGNNAYAYCNNNPANMVDPNGRSALWLLFLLGATVLLAGCSCDSDETEAANAPADFISCDERSTLCYGYVLGYVYRALDKTQPESSKKYKWNMRGDSWSVDGVAEKMVEAITEVGGAGARTITDMSELKEGELLIAVRVKRGDYHFAIRLADGTWADKPGREKARYGVIDLNAEKWPTGYDSKIVLIAVTIARWPMQ